MSLLEQKQNRREFLRTSARNVTLSGLVVLVGAMLFRKHDDRAAHICINEGICGGCRAFSNCILPQAQSARQVEQGRAERTQNSSNM